MPTDAKHIRDQIERYEKLKKNRATLDAYCQELAEVLHVERADFTTSRVLGDRRQRNIYDNVPAQARRGLANALDSMLKPKTARWFHLRADDEELNDQDEVMRWTEDCENRMSRAIYHRRARFIKRSGECDNDLVTFGWGYLFIGENRDKDGLLFRSIHPRDGFIAENSDGVVDTIYICQRYSVRQAAQRWGEENLGKRAQEYLRNNKPDEELEYLWCVHPRKERYSRRQDARAMPFASEIIELDSDEMVSESGFEEFPFAVPRWDGGLYGWSPGSIALPDAQTLQAMGKTLLVGGQRAVDPPHWITSDGVLSPVRTFPGGLTVVDARAFRDAGGRVPMGALEQGANVPIGREMQDATRELVWAAFFRNVLHLPIDRPAMTATEIIERKEEFINTVGPVFGSLETDYPGHICDRVFAIMMRAGAFSPAPKVLANQNVSFEFESPVQRVRRQVEAAGFSRALEMVTPIIQMQPEVMDNFDGDEIIRDLPDIGGFPKRWLRPQVVVDERRAAAAEQQRGMEMMQNMRGGAEIASKVVPLMQPAAGGGGGGGNPGATPGA